MKKTSFLGKAIFLAVLTLTVTVILSVAFSANAEVYSGSCGENLEWYLDTETGNLTITGEGDMDDYYVDFDVPWYSYSRAIRTITIENGVTSIGANAFTYYWNLESVEISDSVKSIGENAFLDSVNLTSIEIPDSVTLIGAGAFSNCVALTQVIMGDGVKSIGINAFSQCTSLRSVDIPASLTEIGEGAFFCCTSIESITASLQNKYFHSQGNCLIETESKTLILGCQNSVIPTDGSVTSIGPWSFYGREGLESIKIPDSVTHIGEYAFGWCISLTKLEIPGSVQVIGDYAFYCCNGLISVILDDGVPVIGDYMFQYCDSLTSIEIPDSVTRIGKEAFEYCSSLASIHIPGNLTDIDSFAFDFCRNLKTVYIDSSYVVQQLTASNSCGHLIDYAKTVLVASDIEELSEYIVSTYPYTAAAKWNGSSYVCYSEHRHTPEATCLRCGLPAGTVFDKSDLDCDGEVSITDITYLLNILSGAEIPEGVDPDVNSDGACDIVDVSYMLNILSADPGPDYKTDIQAWLTWLTEVNAKSDVPTYPMCHGGGVFNILYDGCESKSPWELWPSYRENPSFHMCYMFDRNELDVSKDIGEDNYEFTFQIWYRDAEEMGEYKSIEIKPLSCYIFPDRSDILYRIPTYGAGMELTLGEGETSHEYEMIFIIYKGEVALQNMVGWKQDWVYWTDSSEAYLADALATGAIV